MAVKKKKKKYQNNNKKNTNSKKSNKKKNNSSKKNYVKNSQNINKNVKKNNINNKKNVSKNNVNKKIDDTKNIIVENEEKVIVNENINIEDTKIENENVNIEVNVDVSLDKDNNLELDNNNDINADIKDDGVLEEEVIDIDSDTELDKTVIVKPILFSKYKRGYNVKKNILIMVISLLIVLLGLFIMFFPRIELYGDREIILSYKDEYVEPGYNVNVLDKNVKKDVSVDGDVINGQVGDYELKYYVDFLGIRVFKKRMVKIVDNINPKIDVYNDVINVCPNQEISDFEYSAVDEYDGDITSKVDKIVNENEIILKVSDLSGNSISKEIKIDRVDSVSPVIKLKGDSIMFLEYGQKYIEPGYSVSDNCSTNLDSKVLVSGNVSREIGTYKLIYEVVDESGNKSSVTRKIIVGTKIQDDGVINTGTIYLTFDDGPNQGTTNKILDILKDEGVEATFFVTSKGSDNLIKRIYDEGHMVALHTSSHDYSYIYSSVENYFKDLDIVRDRVKRITGYDSKIIRFPGGSSNVVSRNYKKGIMTELSNLVVNQGYRYYDWNVDAMDASSARNSSDVYYNVTSNLSKNRANVVLMHDTKSITVGALRDIIRFGKEHGYSFKEIDMSTKMVRHGINN